MATVVNYSPRPAQSATRQMQQQVNGNLQFGSNIKGFQQVVTSPAIADTEFSIQHNLGYIPTGWLVFSKDQYSDIRKGATPWTTSKIFLKCNQANVNLTLFVF